jgi:hypothetical protein
MDNVDHNYSINAPPAANALVVDLGSGNSGSEELEILIPPAPENPQSPEVVVIDDENENQPAVVVLDNVDEEMDVDEALETRKQTNERQTEKPGNSASGTRRSSTSFVLICLTLHTLLANILIRIYAFQLMSGMNLILVHSAQFVTPPMTRVLISYVV